MIMKIGPHKASGIDKISARLLRIAAPVIAPSVHGSWFMVHLFHTIYITLTQKEKYSHNTWLQDKIITVQVIKCVVVKVGKAF